MTDFENRTIIMPLAFIFTRWLFFFSGSSHDRQRGADPSHADAQGGAEAHAGLPSPAVSGIIKHP